MKKRRERDDSSGKKGEEGEKRGRGRGREPLTTREHKERNESLGRFYPTKPPRLTLDRGPERV